MHTAYTRLLAIPVLFLIILISACKRTNPYDGHPANVQLFNCLNDGISLYANLSDKHLTAYKRAMWLQSGQYTTRNNLYIGNPPETLHLYASPDTLAKDKPVLSMQLSVKPASIYSLFIYGDKAAPAYSLTEDHFPEVDYKDSVTYVRFANFSNAQPISVNLQGDPPGSFIQSLSFKSISGFQTMPVNKTVISYVFEVRDQASGNLITTYTTLGINEPAFLGYGLGWVYRPNTLVLTGLPAGTGLNQQKISLMAHRGY